jgi:hypothetical protein
MHRNTMSTIFYSSLFSIDVKALNLERNRKKEQTLSIHFKCHFCNTLSLYHVNFRYSLCTPGQGGVEMKEY